jgi:hypothetical protein
MLHPIVPIPKYGEEEDKAPSPYLERGLGVRMPVFLANA